MKAIVTQWTAATGWRPVSPEPPADDIGDGVEGNGVGLVLYFAAPAALEAARPWEALAARYPGARVIGCSTGGEIAGQEVHDDSVVAVALAFARAEVMVARYAVGEDSEGAGRGLALALPPTREAGPLRGVLVLSDGTHVNGSALVRGLRANLPDGLPITGGLAGDGAAFQTTRVGVDGPPAERLIAAVGLYGETLQVRHGSFGGWEPFGPARLVTRSAGNVLYELDGQPALELYRRYLGEEAEQLPGSALLYPLRIRATAWSDADVVRTVVGIDEAAQAMIFAGDVPQGCTAQLMRGNFDRLIAGAGTAAEQTRPSEAGGGTAAAILISCIGRKLLLGPRIAQEVEAVAEVLPPGTAIAGFYSYGEIAPHGFTGSCELHNQTMTITVLSED